MSNKSSTHSTSAPKCDGTLGQFLLMIYPCILRQSGPKNFKNLINKTETMPDPLPALDPDTGEPVTDRAKNERYSRVAREK